jgi:hypothetical protein
MWRLSIDSSVRFTQLRHGTRRCGKRITNKSRRETYRHIPEMLVGADGGHLSCKQACDRAEVDMCGELSRVRSSLSHRSPFAVQKIGTQFCETERAARSDHHRLFT